MQRVTVPRKNYSRSIQTYTALTVVLLIAAGVYGYFQYTKLSEVQEAIANGQAQLQSMQKGEKDIAETYTVIKNKYEADFQPIRDSIEEIYPSEEKYTELTETLDAYVEKNNQSTVNPIIMNNLSFSRARTNTENDYSVLPFTLTLSTTDENFKKFLSFVENSGSLDEGLRLMDIQSITIGFPRLDTGTYGGETAEIPLYNISMALNAYFQIPPDISA